MPDSKCMKSCFLYLVWDNFLYIAQKYLLNLGIGIWKTNSPPSFHPSQREHISSMHSDLSIWGVMHPLGLFCGEAKVSVPSPWGCLGDTPSHSDQHPDGVQLQRPLPSWTLGWERRQSLSVEKREVYWTYIMIIVGFPDGSTVKNPALCSCLWPLTPYLLTYNLKVSQTGQWSSAYPGPSTTGYIHEALSKYS